MAAGTFFPTDLPTSGTCLPAWSPDLAMGECSAVGWALEATGRLWESRSLLPPFLAVAVWWICTGGCLMHVHLGLTALGGCSAAPHCPGGGGGGICSVTAHSSAPGGSLGAERLIPQAAAGRGQRRGHRLARHLGGREGGGSAAGDDRAAAATGQGALGAHDAGGAGEAMLSAPSSCFVLGLGVGCPVG